jgi:hypothetical protein
VRPVLRAVVFGALLSLCLGGQCGHGHPGPCGASNCVGCCDGNGRCQLGDSAQACGFGGGTCNVCNPTQACNGGTCGQPHGDGGPARDGGCGVLNCNGCCDAHGTCQSGIDNAACGNFGGNCLPCIDGGTCTPLTGTDGGGACVPPCSSSNCQGCCQGNTCLDFFGGQSSGACGGHGEACVSCDGGPCLGVVNGTGHEGTCECGAANCAGCCLSFAQFCILPPDQNSTMCGLGGMSCTVCAGVVCDAGVCM